MLIRQRYTNQFLGSPAEPPISNGLQLGYHRRTGRLIRFAAGLLIAAFGLGTGWFAGKALTDVMSPPPVQNGISPAEAGLPPLPHGSQQSVDNSNGAKPEETVTSERSRKLRERDDDLPDYERSTQEVGRKALKQMMKEIKRMNRGEHRNHNDGGQ